MASVAVLGSGSWGDGTRDPLGADRRCRQAVVVTAAAGYESVATELQRLFSGPEFRAYTSTDVAAVEISGAVKNIMTRVPPGRSPLDAVRIIWAVGLGPDVHRRPVAQSSGRAEAGLGQALEDIVTTMTTGCEQNWIKLTFPGVHGLTLGSR